MVMIKLVQTSMCQTCGKVRRLMLDVYRVMQLCVDKAGIPATLMFSVCRRFSYYWITHCATPQGYKILYYRQYLL